jgi:hypothetical protein
LCATDLQSMHVPAVMLVVKEAFDNNIY